MEAHEAAMAAHLAQQAMAAALAAGATPDEAIAAGQAAMEAAAGAYGSAHMMDRSTVNSDNTGPAKSPKPEWKRRPKGENIGNGGST